MPIRTGIAGLGLSWYPTNMLRFVLQGDYVDVDRADDSRLRIKPASRR